LRSFSRLTRLAVAAAVAASLVGGLAVAVAAPAAAASEALPGWLHTSGATIKTAKNKPYVIKAVSWFGMELASCAPHGLWQISLDEGMASIKSMGFNTVRVPFSNECLAATKTDTINALLNPKLFGKSGLETLDAVVARAQAYGLNVILDRHRPSSSAQSALWYTKAYPEKKWISDWTMLAKRYKSFTNVIGVDLHNEPHKPACWGCGVKSKDWQAAATRAGNAVHKVNKNLLIVVEGIEDITQSYKTTWGGALGAVAKHPVKLKVKNHVVYSPHDYPQSVHAQAFYKKAGWAKKLAAAWDRNFGYIVKKKIAPVLLGEFGSKFATANDKSWMKAMISYLKKNGMSWAYWTFNPNSSSTGGLVKDDWVTKDAAKLAALKPILGAGTSVTILEPRPTFTTQPPTGPVPEGQAATWMLGDGWNGGYVAQLSVSSSTPLTHWTVMIADPYATKVISTWGVVCSLVPGGILCTGDDWGVAIDAGQRQLVGIVVQSALPPVNPALAVTGS